MTTRTGARSITHEHLLAVVLSEAGARPRNDGLRILDAGCGDGALLGYLSRQLEVDGVPAELFGFDVRDHGVQAEGFMSGTLAALAASAPGIDWEARLASIAQSDPWPYAPGTFDVVVSNQVLEHVRDHERFFAETHRVLRDGGYAVHLFPLKHYVVEGHLHIPFAHRLQYFDLSRAYIRLMSTLGVGTYGWHRRTQQMSIDTYAERHADYLLHYTNYLGYRDVLRLAKRHGFRPSLRYTKEFYALKARSVAGLAPRRRYRRQSAIGEWIAGLALRYVSSVTLFLEKRESYRAP